MPIAVAMFRCPSFRLKRHCNPLSGFRRHLHSPFPLWKELERWKQSFGTVAGGRSPNRKLFDQINFLLRKKGAAGIQPGEAWSNTATEDLNQMSAEERMRWCKLLEHCQQVEKSKRTPKWIEASNQYIETVGREEFKARVLKWFELVALPRPIDQEPRAPGHSPDPDQIAHS